MTALSRYLKTPAPQSEKLDDRQVKNNAGGFTYQLDPWAQFRRFLILGSEGGTYYVSERKLTADHIQLVADRLAAEPSRALSMAAEVSHGGLAPSNDQALFTVAAGLASGDLRTRQYAEATLPAVARIGTHVFQLLSYYELLSGKPDGRQPWGRLPRRAFSDWLAQVGNRPSIENRVDQEVARVRTLALHGVKYRQRHDWSYRRLLRVAHPKATNAYRGRLYEWLAMTPEEQRAADPGLYESDGLGVIAGYIKINQHGITETNAMALIDHYQLPWEAIPDHLKTADVWRFLAAGMPIGATLRQLATFARKGLLVPNSDFETMIYKRLTNDTQIERSRLHPLQFLDALMVHASGGRAGKSKGDTYVPNAQVLRALNQAFHKAFRNIEPSGKRLYLGIDVSGSMGGLRPHIGTTRTARGLWEQGPAGCGNSKLVSPRAGSMAMALTTKRAEDTCYVAAFSDRMVPVSITGDETLEYALHTTNQIPFGSTDCAQPMLDALAKQIPVDCFVIYTDNETWAGDVHPVAALRDYRQKMGIDAKLVVVGMTATEFSIADPADPGMLDVVGFDSSTPRIISEFARGNV